MTIKHMIFSTLLVGSTMSILSSPYDSIAFILDPNSAEFPHNLPFSLENASKIGFAKGFTEKDPFFIELFYDPIHKKLITFDDFLNKGTINLPNEDFTRLSSTATPCVYNPLHGIILTDSANLAHGERITSALLLNEKHELIEAIRSLNLEKALQRTQIATLTRKNARLEALIRTQK